MWILVIIGRISKSQDLGTLLVMPGICGKLAAVVGIQHLDAKVTGDHHIKAGLENFLDGVETMQTLRLWLQVRVLNVQIEVS